MPALSSKGAVKLGVGRIVAGAVVLIVSFAGALWAFDAFLPGGHDRPPGLAAMPPLKPATRTSTITAPVAVALTAIRDAMEQQAPRELAGKHDNALNQLLGKADISWTLARGPIAVAGPRREGLAIASPLNGMLRVTGEIANQGGNIGGALGSLINSGVGRRLQKLTGNTLDQRADLRANVTITARPIIDNHWRIDPHLGAEVVMGESALSIAGVKLSMPTSSRRCSSTASTRPSRRLRRASATIRWSSSRRGANGQEMCRSISLRGVGANAPDLWPEVRPTQAFAAPLGAVGEHRHRRRRATAWAGIDRLRCMHRRRAIALLRAHLSAGLFPYAAAATALRLASPVR